MHVGLEHDNWEPPSEVSLPGVGILHRDEIYLVEDYDDLLVRHGLDPSLDVDAATGQGVPGVEDFEQNVTVLDNFLHHVEVFVGLEIRIILDFLLPVSLDLEVFLGIIFLLLHEVPQLQLSRKAQVLNGFFMIVGLLVLESLHYFLLEHAQIWGFEVLVTH